jgi:hypothetical protein
VLKLNEYIRRFEDAIQTSPIVRSYEIHVDRKTDDIAYLSGMAEFSDGSMLDFKEFVAAARERIEKYKYAYNYRRQDQFVFRYDNAPDPRARNLPSFPHHVHLSSGKIARSLPKDICGILDCIENSMIEAAGIEPPALNGV